MQAQKKEHTTSTDLQYSYFDVKANVNKSFAVSCDIAENPDPVAGIKNNY